MNVLFYGFQFPHHGRFSAFSALSREFEAHSIQISQMKYPQLPEWVPGRVRGNLHKKWFQMNEYRMKLAFKSGDVVHYFFPENSLFKAPKWKASGSLVLSCHQPVEQLMEYKEKGELASFFEGLKVADRVILMASDEIDEYQQLAPNSQIQCIPHGVDTDYFAAKAAESASDGSYRILTVGSWLRDYDLWAQVVDGVVSECPEVEFSVLANPVLLDAAIAKLKRGKGHVRRLRGISDEQLRDEYHRADAVFLPLHNAWANNTLLESMSCGRPLLVTDLPATREYAGDAAQFMTKGSVDAAVEGLLQLYRNRDARNQLGQQARKRMEDEFTWQQIAQKHLDLYTDILL